MRAMTTLCPPHLLPILHPPITPPTPRWSLCDQPMTPKEGGGGSNQEGGGGEVPGPAKGQQLTERPLGQ